MVLVTFHYQTPYFKINYPTKSRLNDNLFIPQQNPLYFLILMGISPSLLVVISISISRDDRQPFGNCKYLEESDHTTVRNNLVWNNINIFLSFVDLKRQ